MLAAVGGGHDDMYHVTTTDKTSLADKLINFV